MNGFVVLIAYYLGTLLCLTLTISAMLTICKKSSRKHEHHHTKKMKWSTEQPKSRKYSQQSYAKKSFETSKDLSGGGSQGGSAQSVEVRPNQSAVSVANSKSQIPISDQQQLSTPGSIANSPVNNNEGGGADTPGNDEVSLDPGVNGSTKSTKQKRKSSFFPSIHKKSSYSREKTQQSPAIEDMIKNAAAKKQKQNDNKEA